MSLRHQIPGIEEYAVHKLKPGEQIDLSDFSLISGLEIGGGDIRKIEDNGQ